MLQVFLELVAFELVDLGEYESNRQVTSARPLNEIEIDGLRFEPCIDENEQARKAFAFREIALYYFSESGSRGFVDFRIAIARKIHQVPGLVDEEVIYGLRFTRGVRSFREVP